jgi:uncharacterized protein (AIM24 family)
VWRPIRTRTGNPSSPLTRGGGRDRVVGAGEGDEERVSLRVDLAPEPERFAQPGAMVLEHGAVVLCTEFREQPRGFLDVREEEGDGAARQLVHALNSRRWTTLRR